VFPPYGALAGELILCNESWKRMRRFGAGLKRSVRAPFRARAAPSLRSRAQSLITIAIKYNHPHRPGKSARFKVELDGLKTEGTKQRVTFRSAAIVCNCGEQVTAPIAIPCKGSIFVEIYF
jgi:hypothetical protein